MVLEPNRQIVIWLPNNWDILEAMGSEHLRDEEICLGLDEENPMGAVSPPPFQTSLFSKQSLEKLIQGLSREHVEYIYTRGQNPTVELLETKLASLERGETAKCFASGMAAISAVFLGLLKKGDHILFVNQIYGPTLQLADRLRDFGIEYDTTLSQRIDAVQRLIRPSTRIIFLESPGTMLFREVRIRELADLAKSRGIWTVIDNTWATPIFQKPINSGIDLVVHSCSKYLGGHSDVLGGVVIGARELLERIFYSAFLLNGGILAPFDSWLLIRGLRTLPSRMLSHQNGGLKVAEFLQQHPAVRRVFHPALSLDSGFPSTLTGFAGVFSFELKVADFPSLSRVIDQLKRFRRGVSWGGVESLVITPQPRR